MKQTLITIACVSVVVLTAYIVYSATFPVNAAVATKQPFEAVTKKVVPGGVFKYRAQLCKYTDATGNLTRQIVGTESKFVNTEPSNLPKGCSDTIRAVTIPDDTALGKYHMIITAEYHINAFNTDTVTFDTEEFEVISPSSPNAPKPNTPGGIFIKPQNAPTTSVIPQTSPIPTPIINVVPSAINAPIQANINGISVPNNPILPICVLHFCF